MTHCAGMRNSSIQNVVARSHVEKWKHRGNSAVPEAIINKAERYPTKALAMWVKTLAEHGLSHMWMSTATDVATIRVRLM